MQGSTKNNYNSIPVSKVVCMRLVILLIHRVFFLERKTVQFLLLSVFSVSSATAAPFELSLSEKRWLAEKTSIRVAPDPDYRPIEYFDSSGTHQGLAADYLQRIGEITGIDFKIQKFRNWDQVLERAQARETDMFSAASPTEQRRNYMNFTNPLVEVPATIIVRRQVRGNLEMSDLAGMKISVVSGYAIHDFLQDRYPELELDVVPDIQTALRKVSFGMVDAMIGDLATATHYMETQGIANLRVAGESGYVYRLAFAVRKDWPELIEILNKALNAMSRKERQDIFKRWIGMAHQQPWYRQTEYLWYFGVLAAVMLIIGFFSAAVSLKRQVSLRTYQLEKELDERRRTEAALEIRDRAIAAASNGIIITDPNVDDNPVIYANPAFEKITGYSVDEIIGTNCRFLQGDETNQPGLALLREAISSEVPCQVQIRNYRKDGSMFWNELSIAPVRDRDGVLTSFIGIQEDITERKKAEGAIRAVATGVSATTGKAYFDNLVEWLANSLEVNFAFVGRLDPNATEQILTKAVWAHDTIVDNFIYELAHTPCQQVVGQEICIYPTRVQASFPNDEMLQELGVESYLGVPLFGNSGTALGLLAIMHGKPLENPDLASTIMQIFAARTAAEIERIEAEQEVQEEKNRSQQYIDVASVILLALDQSGNISMINRRACRILGYEEQELIGKNWFDTCMPQPQADQFQKHFNNILLGSQTPFEEHENEIITRDGKIRLIRWANSYFRDETGTITGTLSSGEDITERKQSESEMRLAASVFDNSSEGIIITDPNSLILRVNRAFTDITGYSQQEALGNRPSILRSHLHDDGYYSQLWNELLESGNWQGEIWNRRKSGEVHPVWQNITAVKDSEGNITQYISIFSDITERKMSEDRIRHLAHHDVMTALPNRVLFMERCEHALAHARREQQQLAVLFVDLDRFKHINDSLGHPVGDQLLKQIAHKFTQASREEDTIARLGGDEFIVLIEQIDSPKDVSTVARKLLSSIDESFSVAGHELFISASIGISIYPDNGTDVDTLIRNADAAMYRAKEMGRGNYQYYTEELTVSIYERVLMENNLRHAVDRKELVLHYQPQYQLASEEMTACEALLRWIHPEKGLIPPNEFIPIAEDSGLIIPIGEWVMEEACRSFMHWRSQGAVLEQIAVNISGQQIERGDIVNTVTGILQRTGIPPHCLELEISEGFVMKHAEKNIQILNQLKELGVYLSIDDFGIGYSSLNYLKRLPIDRIKLDKSLVDDVAKDSNDEAIARAVLAMGRSLQLDVVAEGVETVEQKRFLQEESCRYVQGYLFSRPLPEDELQSVLPKSDAKATSPIE
jgi:diguanylate cyclase (GGDEF)-like protein/PAS domain S-box-containing protein